MERASRITRATGHADADAVERTATRLLGTHLEMDYVHSTHIGESEVAVRRAYGRREPSFVGCRAPSEWRTAIDRLRAGRPYVFDDIEVEPLAAHERADWERYGIRSQATVPIVRDGRLVATLAACSVAPHRWTDRELEFLTETAERAWTAIELVRGESAREAVRSALASQTRFLDATLSSIPYFVYAFDRRRRFVYVNRATQELFGRDEQVIGKTFGELHHPPTLAARLAAYVDHVFATGETVEDEVFYPAPSVAGAYFQFVCGPVRDASGRITRWLGAATDIHAQRTALDEAERIAAQRRMERDALRRQLGAAEESERRRLAREMHDQLGQHITAFALGLADLRLLLGDRAPEEHRLDELDALAGVMARDTRYLALELRPPELADVGLESALDSYVRQWSERFGIAAELALAGTAVGRPQPGDVSSAIYRIVQEALTNVAKHAAARQVSVVLDESDEEVRLIVEDDGRGFDLETTMEMAHAERRLGLAGMRERAELVRGTLEVESSEGAGTTIYLRVPLRGAGR